MPPLQGLQVPGQKFQITVASSVLERMEALFPSAPIVVPWSLLLRLCVGEMVDMRAWEQQQQEVAQLGQHKMMDNF